MQFVISVALLALLAIFGAQSSDVDTKGVALVTGASSGIGLAVSEYLANEGYKVLLTARREERLKDAVEKITAAGGNVAYFALDVTKESDYVEAFEYAETTFNEPATSVFLNAGWEATAETLVDQSAETVRKIFDINVLGVFTGTREAIKVMRKTGKGGTIVVTSSVLGTSNRGIASIAEAMQSGDQLTSFLAYMSTKAAIEMLVRGGAIYRSENINFYGLKPAVYVSEMLDRATESRNMTHTDLALFNPVFVGIPASAIMIGPMVASFFDGSTAYETGSNVVCDNDCTMDSKHLYANIEDPPAFGMYSPPSSLITHCRSSSGNDYQCTTPETCERYQTLTQTETEL